MRHIILDVIVGSWTIPEYRHYLTESTSVLRIPETARDLDKPFEYMKQEIAYKFRKFSK